MNTKIIFFLTIALFSLNSTYPQIIDIQSEHEYNALKKDHPAMIVQCYAHWCPACKKVMPLFDTLSESEACKQITFARIDIDAVPKIKSEFSLIGVPTFAFIKNEKLMHTEVGIKDFNAFEDHILDIIAKMFS